MQGVTQIKIASLTPGSVSVRPSGSQSSSTAVSSPAADSAQPTRQEVEQAISRANARMAAANQGIRFGFDDAAGQLVVKVVDQGTGEVIRQVPSKEFLAAQAAAREAIGLLLDKQA